jgi:hypothetical protein
MKSQKNAAANRHKAWNVAIAEGRVVRFDDGARLKSYGHADDARAAVAEATAQGLQANIVVVLP